MNSGNLQFEIIQFNSLESSNIYARKFLATKKAKEGLVFNTKFQKSGKGQSGQSWESESGKNLLFSLLLQPSLRVDNQFQLSKSISLGLKKYLDSLSVEEVSIKWPNDILVNGQKIAGILIENNVIGNSIGTSIIGIGFNINQLNFDSYNRTATSLKLIKQKNFQLVEELNSILSAIKSSYFLLRNDEKKVNESYVESLYGYGKILNFEDKFGPFKGVILGVTSEGKLLINKNGKLERYNIKEISFID